MTETSTSFSSGLDRRFFLVAAAVGLALAPHRARAADINPFSLGVASGSPSPDGFVLWTRLAPYPLALNGLGGMDGPAEVLWEVCTDEAMSAPVARGRFHTDASHGYSVHVEVAGLKPDRAYWYRFTALGAQSETGRTRTLPAPTASVQSLKIALATCAHWEVGYYSAYRHMAEENPDLVLFLGDYIYEYSYAPTRKTLVRRHDRREDVLDLAGYRLRYAQYKTDPDLKRLHAVAPCAVTWDDHEVQNDYADRWSQDIDTSEAAFLARRAAGYQAFYENMPLRRSVRTAGGGFKIYNRFRFGDLAEFTMPDGRQYRTIQPCPTPKRRSDRVTECDAMADPKRTMLGAAQEAWMANGFAKSGAKWNIIPQQVQIADMLLKERNTVGRFTDDWSGYQSARQRMIDAVTGTKLKNPVFFSGDLHAFLSADLTAKAMDPASPVVAAEFVAGSITSDFWNTDVADGLARNPRVRMLDNTHNGYISATLTPARMDVRLQVISNRADQNATVSTLKRYAVENGRPGMQDA